MSNPVFPFFLLLPPRRSMIPAIRKAEACGMTGAFPEKLRYPLSTGGADE